MDRDVVLTGGDTPEIWSRADDGEWKLHGAVADLVDEERGRTYRWTTLDIYRDDLFLGDDFGATWRGTSTG